MNRRILYALFAVIVAGQLAVPAWMVFGQETILRTGRLYRFKTAPVDPYDAFRGRYVALNFEQTSVDNQPEGTWSEGETAYAAIAVDMDGFAVVYDLRRTPPDLGDYLRVRVAYQSGDTVRFHFPVDRYYLPEDLAPKAEEAYRDASAAGTRTAYAEIRVRRGEAEIAELYIDGVPIREYVRGMMDESG